MKMCVGERVVASLGEGGSGIKKSLFEMELKLNFELKLPKSSGEPMGVDLSSFTVLHHGEKTQT